MKIPRPKTITPSPKALRFAFNQETLPGNIAGFSVSYSCGRVRLVSLESVVSGMQELFY